jgi:hypothetical protein
LFHGLIPCDKRDGRNVAARAHRDNARC